MTIDELKALNLGYLTGADLLQWCAAQFLIKQYEVDNNSLQNGCDQAISEVIGAYTTRYNLSAELQKTGSARATLLVKTLAILAVRNVLGNMQSISDKMTADFKWADTQVYMTRNGQINLPLPSASVFVASTANLVCDSFKTLG